MAGEVDIGTGTVVAFGASGLSFQILDVKPPQLKRAAIDTSHMGTPAPGSGKFANRTFLPGDLVDGGEVTLSVHFNPSVVVPAHAVAETITITFPTPAGLTTPATWAFSGFLTGYDPTVPLEDKMTADLTFKVSGPVTVTAAS